MYVLCSSVLLKWVVRSCIMAQSFNHRWPHRAAGGVGLRGRSEWRDAAAGGARIQDRHCGPTRHQSDSAGQSGLHRRVTVSCVNATLVLQICISKLQMQIKHVGSLMYPGLSRCLVGTWRLFIIGRWCWLSSGSGWTGELVHNYTKPTCHLHINVSVLCKRHDLLPDTWKAERRHWEKLLNWMCLSCMLFCFSVFSLRFRDAFECMRKLRINLNFIYDHNPQVSKRFSCIYFIFLTSHLFICP